MKEQELIDDFRGTVADHLRRCVKDLEENYHTDKICEKFRIMMPRISAEARKQERERVGKVLVDYFSMSWGEFSNKYPWVERSNTSGLFEIRQALQEGEQGEG